ncbi:MAG: hypothetical protein PHF84_02850, partial [bacterium]|nr:hypothetical protein [bacterium]
MLTNKKSIIFSLKITLLMGLLLVWLLGHLWIPPSRLSYFILYLLFFNVLILASLYFLNMQYALLYSSLVLVSLFFLINKYYFILYKAHLKFAAFFALLFLLNGLTYYILVIYYYIKLSDERKSDEALIENFREENTMLSIRFNENEEKNKSLKIELERMKKLSHTAYILGSTMDEFKLADHLIKEAAGILSVSKVLVSKYSRNEDKFYVFGQTGYTNNVLNQPTDNLDDWIKESKLPTLISNINTETKIKIKKYSPFLNYTSIIAVPIIVTDHVYGILRAENKSVNFFT